ncbi:homing endonuclease associated repeat-containing protein [Paenibacillus bovis]|uniref:Uncharacterized protein n=1 Tax=Paenibacillus bovis TaxID=1616788 RepID=A0A1X9T478_9BACL|nr:hypothetical protein [Paenibacillus bovis]ARR10767.1 hypothetical protein AR543_p0159 [Paenibacillus bovis]
MNTKERQIIECLQKAAAHFQTNSLSCRQYKSYRSKYAPDLLSASTIGKRWGKWSIAIEKAGLHTGHRTLPRCTRCGKRYTRQDSEQGYCPPCSMIRQTVTSHALQQIRYFSREMIILALQAAAGSERTSLTLSEYRRFVRKQTTGQYASSSTICNRFSSWKAALQAAGLNEPPSIQKLSKSPYTTELLLKTLRTAAEQVDGTLTTPKFSQLYQRPSVTVIRNRFGGWNEALQAAGLYTTESLNSRQEVLQKT